MTRTRLLICASLVAISATLVHCSLGLDESLIDRGTAAGDASDADGEPPPETEAGVPVADAGLPGTTCTGDPECPSTNGCFTGRCDRERGRCVYDSCKSAACSSAVCDTTTATCGQAKPYPYKATEFAVKGGSACQPGTLSRCVAAVHPFLFVSTNVGTFAYRVDDPANPTPAAVPIEGLWFVPTTVTASGNRVLFGAGSTSSFEKSRTPLAYIDVPNDPSVPALTAHGTLATVAVPSVQFILHPAASGAALMADINGFFRYPVAVFEPPFTEPLTLPGVALNLAEPLLPAVASGARLLIAGITPAGVARAALVSELSSASPQTTASVELTTNASAQVFATGPNGGVVWSYLAASKKNDGGLAGLEARTSFLVADGAASIDAETTIEVEDYGTRFPATTPLLGPAAMLDATTALVTTAAATSATQTNVQFVKKGAMAPVTNDGGSPRRYTLQAEPTSVAVTAANGVGYAVVLEGPNDQRVYAFDPGCAP